MAKLTLYHAAPSRSSITRWMLEEIGEPYDVHLLSLMKGEQRAPAFLAVNPMGKVPALKHGDVIITEAAAICTYLADEFPKADLNIPIGDPRRGIYLKWLFFGPSCVEAAMIDRAFPRQEERAARARSAMATTTPSWTWWRRRWRRARISWARSSPPPTWWWDRRCAGACCSRSFRSGRSSPPMSGGLSQRPALQRATKKDEELAAA